ncbi:Docking protein 2 [Anas platyrhynchos]|uniref:Docking protein 2 n=1 Tax=Anas platyrhynchos TaxID=8839 RepID=R0JD92_ANAPL|nr:Docking protein 2 [Anas platyrhynchos]
MGSIWSKLVPIILEVLRSGAEQRGADNIGGKAAATGCRGWGRAGLGKEFEVTVRATESSERCRLWGRFVLRAGEEALELRDLQAGEILYSWPYRFLRRFGRDKVTFSFEAGRRCASGEGNFEFETRQGNEIFQPALPRINLLPLPATSSPRGALGRDIEPQGEALALPAPAHPPTLCARLSPGGSSVCNLSS